MLALSLSMLTLGLVTSIHCVSMCGPMVVTYAVKGEEGGPWYRKLVPNLAYQLAKITSYVIVGLALGAIGSAFNIDGVRPYVMLV
ncbi:MAG: sulfite exporter TauE/SafE family protein, partial [Coriobacteriia bacterium]|nr:sulfite exporter TauE/SafE family protein [Coriobacteriia bacterium]